MQVYVKAAPTIKEVQTKMINKIIAPLFFNKNTKGLNNQKRVIAMLFYIPICLMWWFYYMWRCKPK